MTKRLKILLLALVIMILLATVVNIYLSDIPPATQPATADEIEAVRHRISGQVENDVRELNSKPQRGGLFIDAAGPTLDFCLSAARKKYL